MAEKQRGRAFLEVEPELSSLPNIYTLPDLTHGSPQVKGIQPIPGFCVKAKTEDDSKIFINVCHCPDIPKPPENIDMKEIFASPSDEESLFRFPLSLGEPHEEQDKSGKPCICYDVVINSEYYKTVDSNEMVRDFIMTLSCSGIERKYGINIDVGTCTVLKKPYHGTMPFHYIKMKSEQEATTSKSFLDSKSESKVVPKPEIKMYDSREKNEEIIYKLYKIPAAGVAEDLVLQAYLPDAMSSKDVLVFVSESGVVVKRKNSKGQTEVPLPMPVLPKKSLANFFKNKLTIVMPVLQAEGPTNVN